MKLELVGCLCLLGACGRGTDTEMSGIDGVVQASMDVAAVEVSIPDGSGKLHRGTALLPTMSGDNAARLLADSRTRVILRSDDAFKARAAKSGSGLSGVEMSSYEQRVSSARTNRSKSELKPGV